MKSFRYIAALSLLAFASAPALAAQGSGCLPTTGKVSGLSFSQFANAAFQAIISSNSGSAPPSTDCSSVPVKGQIWLDTGVTPNVEKRYDGLNWVVVGALDTSNHVWSPPVGGGTATVTANSITDICAAPAAVHSVTGTTPIITFGSSCVAGTRKTLIFNSATPLTYNATSLILPGRQSYTSEAGDVAEAIYLGASNWRVVSITKIDGSSVTNPSVPVGTILHGMWGTLPAKTMYATNGAIPRASYPAYTAAMTRVQTGTLSFGSATITSMSNYGGLGTGMPLEGNGLQAGTTIVSVSGSSVVMSKTAVANGSQVITTFITGYGAGGDTTTIGLPECRGRILAGRDDQGPGAAGALSTTYFGTGPASPYRIGALAGFDSFTLSLPYLPSLFLPATTTIGVTLSDSGHVHNGGPVNVKGFNTANAGDVALSPSAGGSATTIAQTQPSLSGVSVASTSASTQVTLNGSNAPFPLIQPTAIAECVVVVSP